MDDLVLAIKQLRADLGDSQQAFATRLGLSIRAIANYEASRRPTISVLEQLVSIAGEQKRIDLQKIFTKAYSEASAGQSEPRTDEERAFVRAVLYLVRNRHLVPNWRDLRQNILGGMESVHANKTGSRMTSPEDIALALSESRRYIAIPPQEQLTKLARERAKETGNPFWTAYEQVVETNPQLQRQLEKEKERDLEEERNASAPSIPKRNPKRRKK